MQVTEVLSQFVADKRFKDTPPQVVELAKRAFFDCFGVILAAAVEPIGKMIQGFVREMGGNPVSGVIGGGFRTSPPWAALANGVMAHALDYDDGAGTHVPLHISVPLVPVALALGEELEASGKEVLQSYIIGLEIAGKIASGVTRSHMERGIHPTGIIGPLGAAAAAANILGLGVDETRMALGMAASTAGGLVRNFGTYTKPFHAGKAAWSGVVAAKLAQKGWSADPNILEGPAGFCDVLVGKGEYNLAEMTKGLGNPYHFVSPGLQMKIYPSCRGTHPSLEVIFELMRLHPFLPEEVKSIECGVDAFTLTALFYHRPVAPLQAKFSLEFCLAAAVVDRQVRLAQFTEDKLRDPRLLSVLEKVKVYAHPDFERTRNVVSTITVRLNDGREYTHTIQKKKSEVDPHLNWEELIPKFKECAQLTLPEANTRQLIEMLQNIEEVKSVRQLMDLALYSVEPRSTRIAKRTRVRH